MHKIMMALENKEAMQRIEASLKGLQSKGNSCNLQYNNGNSVEGFPKFKDDISAYQGGDVGESVSQLSTEFLECSNEFYNNPTYQHDFCSWSTYYPDSQKVHRCQMNPFESQFYPLPLENRFHYALHNTFTPAYPYDFRVQDFQYFVVIDFEATCDKEKNPHPQEIIEFPSVIVSSVTGQLEACFQTYVRPTCNQLLSDFCKDLTGIQQIQVDRGVTLSEALLRHDKWLENKGIKHTNFAVVTWSNWDCRVMLESECRFKKIRKPPYFNRWINLKVPFCEVFGGVRCNLKEAVEMAGLAWQGRAHCGLDDAKNTAHLLALLMRRGFKFSITNSLMWQATDVSLACNQFPERMPFSPHHLHKPKDPHVPHFQYHPYCFCGVKSSKGIVRKPGPKQGSVFFGCGNWTVTRGARCHYFEWATP
ncbi:3'-5' exoribonuclease 1-like [Mangifera indica]|uniref:3'-5' exoribonuclease 1-like n=1 Tax=Mangifera indica TaxID=29780 RepID=UPI001CF9682D|nr:3'-5' exoribonuclease 1-like [Mangifera indica]